MNEKGKSDIKELIAGIIGLIVIIGVIAGIMYLVFFSPSTLQKKYPGVESFKVEERINQYTNKSMGNYGVLKYTHLTDNEIVSLCENYFPKQHVNFVILEQAPGYDFGYQIGILQNPKEDIISEGYLTSDKLSVGKQTEFVAITTHNTLGRLPYTPNPVPTPKDWL